MQQFIDSQYELFPTQTMITVSLDEYTNLRHNTLWMEALQAAGVDNWEGISEAHEIYHLMKKEI